MAELNQAPAGATPTKKVRSRKLNSRVDLTAMVDLAFLLITFFMLTTSLGKPKSMNLTMPNPNGESGNVDEHRTMTILIGEQNTAYCYMGFPSEKTEKKVVLGTSALRQELTQRNKEALAYSEAKGKKDQGLIVIIKPGKQSNYGNLVDVLDEMAISNIGTYAISEIDKKEIELLKN